MLTASNLYINKAVLSIAFTLGNCIYISDSNPRLDCFLSCLQVSCSIPGHLMFLRLLRIAVYAITTRIHLCRQIWKQKGLLTSQRDGRGSWKFQCSYSSRDLCVLAPPSQQISISTAGNRCSGLKNMLWICLSKDTEMQICTFFCLAQ